MLDNSQLQSSFERLNLFSVLWDLGGRGIKYLDG